ITAVRHNINIYLEYIKKTKPIAEKVYHQYSQLKM
ncbi:BBA14 family lipoprotein, partial [Borreliella burgdorferi]